ncbi:MAG: LptF/LptG family permease [Deltaproteobacteria bacterium]|nr:LptF/LptG family permease [Deltaproteobacteria bacterium]
MKVLIVLLLLYSVIDIVELGSRNEESYTSLLLSYWYKIPYMISQLLPLSLFIGGLLSAGGLKKRGEFTVIWSTGNSFYTPVISFGAAAVLFTFFNYFIINDISPFMMAKLDKANNKSPVIFLDTYVSGSDIVTADCNDTSTQYIIRRKYGEAVNLYMQDKNNGTLISRWNKKKGWKNDDEKKIRLPETVFTPAIGDDGVVGRSLKTDYLKHIVKKFSRSGIDLRQVKAVIVLRNVTACLSFFIPVTGWFLGYIFNLMTPLKAIFFGVVSSAAFWLLLAFVWTGSTLGVISVSFIWVPGVLAIVLAVVSAIMSFISFHRL